MEGLYFLKFPAIVQTVPVEQDMNLDEACYRTTTNHLI